MNFPTLTSELLRRQTDGSESGANKLLDLLANPYRSQVSLESPSCCVCSKPNVLTACPIVHFRVFGYIRWFYPPPRSRLLPPKTLQLRRLLPKIEDCR